MDFNLRILEQAKARMDEHAATFFVQEAELQANLDETVSSTYTQTRSHTTSLTLPQVCSAKPFANRLTVSSLAANFLTKLSSRRRK
jgi:hypothetical protein